MLETPAEKANVFGLEGKQEAVEIVNDIELSNSHPIRHMLIDYLLCSRHCSRPWGITVSKRVKKISTALELLSS